MEQLEVIDDLTPFDQVVAEEESDEEIDPADLDEALADMSMDISESVKSKPQKKIVVQNVELTDKSKKKFNHKNLST